MALQSGIFSAVENDGVYDRFYGAEFFTKLIGALFYNCIIPGGFTVSKRNSGLTLDITAGQGVINGILFYDDSASTLTCSAASGTRNDLVVARLNINARTVTLAISAGTSTAASNEIVLASVTVKDSDVKAVSNEVYTRVLRNVPHITYGSAAPSGGENGDIYLQLAD